MSQTVDNRVVELGFNNKEFEQGTKQSLKSIEAMKKGLNFDESSKSIANLSRASKGFSLSTMAEGVQGISNRFSTLGIIGMTIIQNLTNAAINYGKKLVSSIMEPIKMGFSEYEIQMNAIQTVLANTASKGTTLEDVSAALDELNTYADKTIYNFTEMTRNIGTFTAAGVDLDTSTQAIKGIANLAAVSGSNAQQASTAMYQLSQALSSGTVKLMDWNSVVNAGMGGQVFQDALKETARVSGIAIDDLIDKHGSFRETLSTGWLSSEVLLDTLQKFTGDLSAEQLKTMGYTEEQIEGIIKLGQTANDAATKVKTFTQLKDTLQEALQSGWTKSWEIIVGDFEEAKEVFTEISDTLGAMIGESADARNKVLSDWKLFGGRTAIIDAIRYAFEGVLSIMGPIKEAFFSVFSISGLLGYRLAKLSKTIRDLAARLVISGETADQIKRIFTGFFSGLAIGIDLVRAIASGLWEFAKVLYSMSGVNITGSGILEFLANLGDRITNLRDNIDFEFIGKAIFDGLYSMIRYLQDFKYAIINGIDEIRNTFTGIFDGIDLSPVQEFFGKFEVRFKPFQTLLKGMAFIIGAILQGATKLIPGLFRIGQAIFEFAGKLGSMIIKGLMSINFSEVFDIINSGLIGAILLAIRNFINSGSGVLDEVGGVFGGVIEILDGVRGSLEAWQQNLKSKTLLNIAAAIGILAAALLVISLIDSDKLTVSLLAVTAMFTELITAQAAFSKFGTGGIGSSAALVMMATSLLIIAGALTIVSKIDPASVSNALGTIFALMAGMVAFSKLMSGGGANMASGSLGMVAIAISMLVLTKVVEKLGSINPGVLQQGLIGVGVMLAEIAAFMRLVDEKGSVKGLGLLIMAGAILVLGQSVEKLGNLDIGVLQQGLQALGAVLAGLAIFTRVSGDGKGMIATSIGVVILAGALEIFTDVIQKLGAMNSVELATGLAGMAGALLIIAIAMRALPKNMIVQAVSLLIVAGALTIMAEAIKSMGGMTWEEIAKGLATLAGSLLILSVGLYAMSGTLMGSAALLIASGALFVLANVLQTLGSMPLGEILLALGALAGIFVVLGIAGLVLTPIVPTLLGLGAAMLLIGIGAALVGVGLLAFSTGLVALAAGGATAAVGIVAFVTTLLGLVPVVIQTLIDTLIIFAKGIQKAAPEVAKAITALMLGFLQVIIDVAPKIFETLDILLKGLIQLIVDHVPDFIAAVVLLLLTLLQEIAAKMPDFIQAGFDILISFLTGIRDNIAEVVTVVSEIIVEFLGAVADNLPDIIDAGWETMVAFINGMADAVDNNMDPLLEAIGRLAKSIISGLVTGITKGVDAVIQAIKDLVAKAIAAAWAAFDSTSPSKEMIKVAKTVPEGIVAGLKKYGYKAVNQMEKFGTDVVDTMSLVGDAIKAVMDNDSDFNPTISPIVDMSLVEKAGERVNNLFSTATLDLAPVLSNVSSISTGVTTPMSPNQTTINEGTKVVFNQTNNSPRALSEIEIYRQTRNQLLRVEGLV
jgi:tape measure domain-containing protein